MTAINIGNKHDKASVEALVDGVVKIFETAEKTRMEQSTVVAALELVASAGDVSGITITGCSFASSEIEEQEP